MNWQLVLARTDKICGNRHRHRHEACIIASSWVAQLGGVATNSGRYQLRSWAAAMSSAEHDPHVGSPTDATTSAAASPTAAFAGEAGASVSGAAQEVRAGPGDATEGGQENARGKDHPASVLKVKTEGKHKGLSPRKHSALADIDEAADAMIVDPPERGTAAMGSSSASTALAAGDNDDVQYAGRSGDLVSFVSSK